MAAAQDVHVRICNQEIVRFDLEVKALIQVLTPRAPAGRQPPYTAPPAACGLRGLAPELAALGQGSPGAGPALWPAAPSLARFGPFP